MEGKWRKNKRRELNELVKRSWTYGASKKKWEEKNLLTTRAHKNHIECFLFFRIPINSSPYTIFFLSFPIYKFTHTTINWYLVWTVRRVWKLRRIPDYSVFIWITQGELLPNLHFYLTCFLFHHLIIFSLRMRKSEVSGNHARRKQEIIIITWHQFFLFCSLLVFRPFSQPTGNHFSRPVKALSCSTLRKSVIYFGLKHKRHHCNKHYHLATCTRTIPSW